MPAAWFPDVHLPSPGARRDVRAERHRTDIARPGIGADQVRFAFAADAKAAGFDRGETEMSVRANDPQRIVGRTSVLDRNGHAGLSSSVLATDLITTAIISSRSGHDHG